MSNSNSTYTPYNPIEELMNRIRIMNNSYASNTNNNSTDNSYSTNNYLNNLYNSFGSRTRLNPNYNYSNLQGPVDTSRFVQIGKTNYYTGNGGNRYLKNDTGQFVQVTPKTTLGLTNNQWSTALSGIQLGLGIANTFQAYKTYKLQKNAMEFNKDMANKAYTMKRKTYNNYRRRGDMIGRQLRGQSYEDANRATRNVDYARRDI